MNGESIRGWPLYCNSDLHPTMPIARFLLTALLSVGLLHAQETASTPPAIKVVFWNMEWFPGGDIRADAAQAKAQIALVQPAMARMNPDIIGMQEVRDGEAARIALENIPDVKVQLASAFQNEDGSPSTQQLIIASRMPAIGAWWEPWKAGDTITPKRGFSFAAFEPAPGRILLVYSIHLKSNRGNLEENTAMREESARQLVNHIAAMEKAYASMGSVSVIVGGDFNTSIDDAKFAHEKTLSLLEEAGFQSAWKNMPLTERVTIPSTPSNNPNFPPWPDATFDYIFVKGARLLNPRVEILDPAPSDHRPVMAEVVLAP